MHLIESRLTTVRLRTKAIKGPAPRCGIELSGGQPPLPAHLDPHELVRRQFGGDALRRDTEQLGSLISADAVSRQLAPLGELVTEVGKHRLRRGDRVRPGPPEPLLEAVA